MRLAGRTRWTVALVAGVAALAAAGLAVGLTGSSDDPSISVPALQNELATVIGFRLEAAHFYRRHVAVSCEPTGSDGLHFMCHIDAANPRLPTQSWDETVACRPPGRPNVPRCFSDRGDALQ